MGHFPAKDGSILFCEKRQILEPTGILCDKSTLLEYICEVAKAMAIRESGGAGHELVVRHTLKRVCEFGIDGLGSSIDVLDAGGDLGDSVAFLDGCLRLFVLVRHRE